MPRRFRPTLERLDGRLSLSAVLAFEKLLPNGIGQDPLPGPRGTLPPDTGPIIPAPPTTTPAPRGGLIFGLVKGLADGVEAMVPLPL